MVPVVLTNNNDNHIYDCLYESIYMNIDMIIQKYKPILAPEHNNTTLDYIKQGYEVKEAYSMSFMLSLLLWMNI